MLTIGFSRLHPNQKVLVVARDGTKVKTMPNGDRYESELIAAFNKGNLESIATKSELSKFKAALRATAIKDQ